MKKIKPVTFKNLKDIFKSRKFTSRLKQVEEITNKTGCEASFNIYRGVQSSKFYFGDVPENDQGIDNPYDSCMGAFNDQDVDMLKDDLYNGDGAYSLIGLHTHPDIIICPSQKDILVLFQQRLYYRDYPKTPYDVFPLMAVSEITCKDNLEVLVFQNTDKVPSELEAEYTFDKIVRELGYDIGENELVAETIDALPNFNASLLRYDKSSSIYKLPDSEISKLEKFAFTPSRI